MRNYLIGTSLLAVASVAPAHADEIKFKPLLDTRMRYETVDQTGFANTADSVTVRVRLGGEVSYGPFAALVEGEGLFAPGDDYNSTTNGKAALFPVVADPENVELNRIQLQYKGIAKTVMTVGRQRINLDDQRFVGAVGWRQNEQTFDAVRVEYSGIKNVKADIIYSWNVQTIFGIDGGKYVAAQPRSIQGDNILGNLSYKTKYGTLTGFAYLVDQNETALLAKSSQTFGARFAGSHAFNKTTKLSYAASYARQSDYHRNPQNYTADYIAAELGLDAMGFKLTGGYEKLGAGNGVVAFSTPLATLHKFNGWADKFLNTPARGLRDYYAGIGYTIPKVGKMGPLTLAGFYHSYDSDAGKVHFGKEWNAQAMLKLNKQLSFTAKYADYLKRGATGLAGDATTRKVIVQMDYIF